MRELALLVCFDSPPVFARFSSLLTSRTRHPNPNWGSASEAHQASKPHSANQEGGQANVTRTHLLEALV